MKIIYIEDNPTNLFLVKKILEKQPQVNFMSAVNGEEGIQLVKLEKPEMVLLDINLPGLSGYEIAKEIRRDPNISSSTLIAVSANNMEEDKKIAYAVGCDGYIEKPISPKTFWGDLLMIHNNKGHVALQDKEYYLDIYTNKLIDSLKDKINQLEASNMMLKKVDKIKSDFISVASHELKTPIVPITGYLDLLQKEKFGPLTDKQKDIVGKVGESADRLSNIINRIIDMARLEKGLVKLNKSRISASQLINKVVANLTPIAELRHISIAIHFHNSHTQILCDEDKIEFVIYNILNNAIKFSEDGSEVEIGFDDDGEQTIIYVKDKGIGIDNSDTEMVFNAFFSGWDTGYHHTSDYEFQGKGIGLGLAISKDFISMHQGRIWVESEGKGQGSTFYFTIPSEIEV